MNLQPINPPMSIGVFVFCVVCGDKCGSRHKGVNVQAWADLDDKPGTYYCQPCADNAMRTRP